MRSRWLKSVNGLAMLLLFGAGVAEQSSAHPCPFHGGALAALVANAAEPAHDQAATEHQHHAQHSEQHQTGEHRTCCTCVGDCNAATTVAIITAPVAMVAIVGREVDAPLPDAARIAVTSRTFLLPFANGPPAAARIA